MSGQSRETISFPPAHKRRLWNNHDTGLNGYPKGSDACHNFFFWFVKYFYFIFKFYLALFKIDSHPETFCPFARYSLRILPRDFTGDSLSSSPMSPLFWAVIRSLQTPLFHLHSDPGSWKRSLSHHHLSANQGGTSLWLPSYSIEVLRQLQWKEGAKKALCKSEDDHYNMDCVHLYPEKCRATLPTKGKLGEWWWRSCGTGTFHLLSICGSGVPHRHLTSCHTG